MKTIIKLTIALAMMLAMVCAQAQTISTSVSISNSDENYAVRAKFPSEKYTDVLTVLMDNLNAKNLTESNGKQKWVLNSSDDEVYNVSLSNTRLSLHLDKELAASELIEKFEEIGETLRFVISDNNDSKAEAERLLREADRMRRDAERMQNEAERLQNMAIDDSKNIAEEAKRLAEIASELNKEASHKGGINKHVRTLLNSDKTNYNPEFTNKNNWMWPETQSTIIRTLKEDKLIKSDNNISFIYDHSGMYVNGTKLNNKQINRYSSIFQKHDSFRNYGFSFYKSGNNIVVINDRPNVEGFIKDLISKGLISSRNTIVKLEINGNTVYKNGTQLSVSELNSTNSLLHKNNIIPAPGKVFEIFDKGYKLGYQFGNKGHLGTWKMND